MKRIAALLLTLAVALCAALPVLAAGTIEVTEDVSVSDVYVRLLRGRVLSCPWALCVFC